ncbi:MAG: flippase-like domain-containing protein [Burkholderiales bacterium]|nr:flippase-like domain-containing protein [Bacteroidia bacterium]
MRKNIKQSLIFSIKILIGILSFWIIYKRLNQIPHLQDQFIYLFNEPAMYLIISIVILLMPINWGIESYKWKLITRQIESIPYTTALKSVFTGICVGNIAPGRAMEFLAKIFFFKPENRPGVTVLHFINGMFQMLITVTMGIISIAFKLNQTHNSTNFIYLVIIGGICMLIFFCWAIFNVAFIQKKLKFIKWFRVNQTQQIKFSKTLIIQLISFSIIRYLVFTTQFYLLFNSLSPQNNIPETFMSIAAYFMLTSLIPMVSVIEPAIRAAIAIFVFNNFNDSTIIVVLSSTFIWIINVVIPSLIGYIIILKEKIDFRSARAN